MRKTVVEKAKQKLLHAEIAMKEMSDMLRCDGYKELPEKLDRTIRHCLMTHDEINEFYERWWGVKC